jgi:hypothetical protein
VDVSYTAIPTISVGQTEKNPLMAALNSIDVIAIVQVVLGLLVLLFAYDVISGEREQGTLAQALANSVPRHAILATALAAAHDPAGVPDRDGDSVPDCQHIPIDLADIRGLGLVGLAGPAVDPVLSLISGRYDHSALTRWRRPLVFVLFWSSSCFCRTLPPTWRTTSGRSARSVGMSVPAI